MNTHAYWVAFAAAARRTGRDHSSFAIRGGFFLALVLVFAAIWGVATKDGALSFHGYHLQALVWYMMASEAVVVAVPSARIEQIGDEIAAGVIEDEMLRPASVAGIRLASDFGAAIARLIGLWALGCPSVLLIAGPPPEWSMLPLTLGLSVLAVACNVVGVYVFAACSFWAHDVNATWFLYQKLLFLLGGMLLPLAFLPDALETAAWVLPFWTMAYAPAETMSGHFIWWLPLGQLAWGAALTSLAIRLFVAGERSIQVGGR